MSCEADESPAVLIVDDNDVNRLLASDVLAWTGFRVLQAADGHTALRLLVEDHPAAVVLDLLMPGMGGLEVLRRIRVAADARLASVPVLVTTAMAYPANTAAALEAGANTVLVQPYRLRTLCRVVNELVTSSRGDTISCDPRMPEPEG